MLTMLNTPQGEMSEDKVEDMDEDGEKPQEKEPTTETKKEEVPVKPPTETTERPASSQGSCKGDSDDMEVDNNGDTYTLFLANNNWYLFFRLHQLLCERIATMVDHINAHIEEDIRSRNRKQSTAIALKLKSPSDVAPSGYRAYFMEMIKSLLDGNLDSTMYEDQLRETFTIHAYLAFTMDKTVQNIVRQLQHIVCDEPCIKITELFHSEKANGSTDGHVGSTTKRLSAETAYQRRAEQILTDENCYKILVYANECKVSIELLDTDHEQPDEPIEVGRWTSYMDKFMANEDVPLTGGKSPRKLVFLPRNVRKWRQTDPKIAPQPKPSEQTDAIKPDSTITTDDVEMKPEITPDKTDDTTPDTKNDAEKTDDINKDDIKTDEVKTDDVKTDEVKTDNINDLTKEETKDATVTVKTERENGDSDVKMADVEMSDVKTSDNTECKFNMNSFKMVYVVNSESFLYKNMALTRANKAMILGVLAENSLPFTMAPTIIDLAKELSKDPKMLSELSMDRTSASYKTTYGLSKTITDTTISNLRKQPFCLNIDEATSHGEKRVLGVLVSYFSEKEGRVVVEHLAAIELIRVNTDSIFDALCTLFKDNEIPWSNLTSILMDSCAVMRGSKNGLEVRIRREKCQTLLDIDGDICHHIHNASKKFCAPFGGEVEGLFHDLHNDLKWSADLKEMLAEICCLLGIKFTMAERFISHRWLSCYDCSTSTLRMFDAFKVFYFAFIVDKDLKIAYLDEVVQIFRKHSVNKEARNRIKEVWEVLRKKNMTDDGKRRKQRIVRRVLYDSISTLLTMHFYTSGLPLLKSYVVLFQTKAPMVHLLHDKQLQLFKDFLSCFVKSETIVGKSATELKSMTLTNYNDLLRKSDIFTGPKAKEILKTLDRHSKIREKFFTNAQEAYKECAIYLQMKLPLDNRTLQAAACIDPAAHGHHVSLKHLSHLCDIMKHHLTYNERDTIGMSLHRYIVDARLPAFDPNTTRIDEWWFQIKQQSDKYPALCKVALAACTIFHGPQCHKSVSLRLHNKLSTWVDKWRGENVTTEQDTACDGWLMGKGDNLRASTTTREVIDRDDAAPFHVYNKYHVKFEPLILPTQAID